MPKCTERFSKRTQVIPAVLVLLITMSNFAYQPISVWAQESSQNYGQSIQNGTQTFNGMHPCFGQNGNQTGFKMHNFGQFGNHTGNRMHNFGQNGTQGTHRINPCLGPNSNQTGSWNKNGSASSQGMTSTTPNTSQNQIPSWVRSNAKWWAQNQVTDSDFIKGIQYLIQQGIMKIPPTHTTLVSSSQQIPSWIKSNAGFWAQGQISDDDFVKGVQYLITSGIMKIS